jgi:hypothetical protein
MRNGPRVAPRLLALLLVAVGFLSVDRAFPKDGPVQTSFSTVAQSLIVVPVKVNGAGPYEFLLDTGTSRTIVNQKVAAKSILPRVGVNVLSGFQRTTMLSLVHAASISLAGCAVADLDVYTSDKLPYGLGGILGEDFLRSFDLLIDNRAHVIQLNDGSSALADSLAGEHLPLRLQGVFRGQATSHRLMISGIASEFGGPLLLQLDSGATRLFIFPEPVNAAKNSFQETISVAGAFGHSESYPLRTRVLKALVLGNRFFSKITACTPSQKVETDADGVLPTALFHSIFISHAQRFAILDPSRIPDPGERIHLRQQEATTFR